MRFAQRYADCHQMGFSGQEEEVQEVGEGEGEGEGDEGVSEGPLDS
jgi:hypothetical protein